MLPKKHRLISDYDFRRIRSKGNRINTPFFTFFYLKQKMPSPSRFGFVISTKVDKRATERNRVKRLLREGVGALLPSVREGYDGAFWIRRTALEAKADDLSSAVENTFKRGGVLKTTACPYNGKVC